MAIQRWDPLRDVLQLQERVNRLFEEVMARSGAADTADSIASGGWKPAVDIYEQSDRYVILADLPGIAPTDVEVDIEQSAIVLRGERHPDPTIPKEAYLRVERPRGRFALQIALPPSVDRQGIEAKRREGVLEVVLPKKKEQTPSRVKVDVR
jgi:HSP20 family protein